MRRTWGTGLITAIAVWACAGLIAAGARAGGPAPGAPERAVLFSGTDAVDGAMYSHYGIIVAFNRDLSRDGWLLRAYGARADYDTDPGDGRGWEADLMLGYGFTRGALWGSIFVGADYQDYEDDAPGGAVDGTEVGLKIAGELSTLPDAPLYVGLSGHYSTAFDSYWARFRIGMHRHGLTFGPEGIVHGDEDYDAQRLGAFVTFHDLNPLRLRPFDMTVSGGYQFLGDDSTVGPGGDEGIYGAISFTTLF
jgi:hypothetical protein